MGVEVVLTDVPSMPVEDGNEGNITKNEMGFRESAEFHSEDTVNEWPKPKKIHTFYFVKYPSYEDPKLKSKFEKANKEIQKNNQALLQITEAIKENEWKKMHLRWAMAPLPYEQKRYKEILDEQRNRVEYLYQALVKLRNVTDKSREKDVELCSSEEELNYLIRSLHLQTRRSGNTLVEEKQLLRAIQQLEGTREKVIANASMKQKLFWRMREYRDTYKYSWKDYRQERINEKPMDLNGVRKEKKLITDKIKYLNEKVKAMDDEISTLKVKSTAINCRKNAAYGAFLELEKRREEENADYYQNCSLLNNARELAAKKNLKALEELSRSEVEKFMSQWSSSKAFRDDYVNRISPSLDSRQLSEDGRIRNPGKKIFVSEFLFTSESEMVTKVHINKPMENSTACLQKFEKPHNETSASNEIDAMNFKEMNREEEIAKVKVALERKNKKMSDKQLRKKFYRPRKVLVYEGQGKYHFDFPI